jgi:hydrogenase expression/formation protein HypC
MMCLAVPGQIVEITQENDTPLGRMASVDFQGNRIKASLAMTPEAGEGDWVLIHAGFAISRLDEEEAMETFEALRLVFGQEAEDPAGGGDQ